MIKAVSNPNVDLVVGQQWRIEVSMDGTDTPVLAITLPDGTTLAPAVEFEGSDCGWVAAYVPLVAGRFLGTVTTAEDSSIIFQAWVAVVTANTSLPDKDDLDDFLGGAGQHSWSDGELTDALVIESAAQRRVCRIPAAYPDDLRAALLRRAARYLNMKRQLTEQPRSDGGDFDLPNAVVTGRDWEIRRYESPWRKIKVA